MLVPITYNNVTTIYKTNAPIQLVGTKFLESSNYNELKLNLENEGYYITEYIAPIKLNFDEK